MSDLDAGSVRKFSFRAENNRPTNTKTTSYISTTSSTAGRDVGLIGLGLTEYGSDFDSETLL